MEEWRPVRGYEGIPEGHYEVSSYGKVRSVTRLDGNGHLRRGKILKPYTDSFGRRRVALRVDTKEGTKYPTIRVHRLVAFAFLGDPKKGEEVCHNDGNSSNNRASNLRWDTHKGNMADKAIHGTNKPWNYGVTECKWGHPFDEANTYIDKKTGKRGCRKCRNAAGRRRNARNRALQTRVSR